MKYYLIFAQKFPGLFTRFLLSLLLMAGGRVILLMGFGLIMKNFLGDIGPGAYAGVLLAGFLLFNVFQRMFHRSIIAYSHRLIEQLRNETVRRFAKLPLLEAESFGIAQVYARINGNMDILSNEITHITVFTDGLATMILGALFLKQVSFAAFVVYNLMILFVAALSYEQKNRTDRASASLAASEEAFSGMLEQSILGIKEITLDSSIADAVGKSYKSTVLKSRDISASQALMQLENSTLGFWIYLGTAIIVFLLPKNGWLPIEDIPLVLLCVFFLNSSFLRIITGAGSLWSAESALKELLNFNKLLNKKTGQAEKAQILGESPEQPMLFENGLSLKGFGFSYPAQNGAAAKFALGPIDMDIAKNEILFIVGGNGSGKSSFLKALTGLYPWEGEIQADGQSVTAGNLAEYQSLFSIIFTDFHLFDKAYGLEHVKPEHINHWIDIMGMADKTVYQDGAFSTTDLSTGQRKRLALISAIAENKRIYVFDEVAADQDPENRKFFYEQVLPDLKKMGKTIIAVSHDDHYFHAADRVIEFKDGKMWEK